MMDDATFMVHATSTQYYRLHPGESRSIIPTFHSCSSSDEDDASYATKSSELFGAEGGGGGADAVGADVAGAVKADTSDSSAGGTDTEGSAVTSDSSASSEAEP